MDIMDSDESPNPDFAWCKFEARQQHSIIIQFVVLLSQLCILGVVAIAINKAKRLGQLNQLSTIYKLIFAWLFSFFVKTLLNIYAYLQFIGQSADHQNNSNQVKMSLKVLSSIFFLFDLLTTFFLQTTMIYIPYLWIRNALKAVTDENFSLQEQKSISRRFKVKKIIKKYIFIRSLYPLLYLTMCFLLICVDNFYVYTHFLWIIATIQSVVIICVYFSGYLTYQLLKSKLAIQKRALKSMFIQYMILMLCCLTRIIINIMFYFSSLIDYEPDSNCYDNHDQSQTKLNCIFLAMGLILMHTIPGLLIIYVYWPSVERERSLTDSLLLQSNKPEETQQSQN